MSESQTDPKSILVVDDEPDVRRLVERVLSDAGYRVRGAADGAAALEQVRAERPDLMLLDLMMPVLDGWGVLERLRDQGDPLPVIILTARGDDAAFTRSVRAGVAGYLAKPFQFADLIATCRHVLKATLDEPPAGDERRRLPRRDLMVKVRVLSETRSPAALGELVNLSPGGAQVNLIGSVEPGSLVRVGLHVAAAEDTLTFEGRIQWRTATPDGYAHGLLFVNLGDETRARLEALLMPA